MIFRDLEITEGASSDVDVRRTSMRLVHDLGDALADREGDRLRAFALGSGPAHEGEDVGHPLLHHRQDRCSGLRLGPLQHCREIVVGVLQETERQTLDRQFVGLRKTSHMSTRIRRLVLSTFSCNS